MTDLPLPPKTSLKTIIEKTYLEEYQKGIKFIWFEISSLHINIYLIEKITSSYPHELFLDSYENAVFLSCFVNNAIDMAILIEARLLDPDDDVFTIGKFGNDVNHKFVKPEYRKAFKEHRKPYKLNASDKDIQAIRNDLRHMRIAHLNRDFKNGIEANTLKATHLYLPEIKGLCEKLTAYFRCLSLNSNYELLPSSYAHAEQITYQLDIDEVLDGFAQRSKTLHMPEVTPEEWAIFRSTLSQQQIDQFNQYRRKFGMAEA